MNSRRLAIASLVLNAVLLAAVLRKHAPDAPATPTAGDSAPVTAPTRQLRGEPTSPPDPTPPTTAGEFHWSQVAADDLFTYRDRLLAIGCPHHTARDILLAEINHRFDGRFAEVAVRLQGRFWEMFSAKRDLEDLFDEELDPLKSERRELIEALLGGLETNAPAESLAGQLAARELEFAWLPADKRQRLAALELDEQQQLGDVDKEVDQLPPPQRQAERLRRRAQITAQTEAARHALLTPVEHAELELRRSGAADWAANSPGFEPTEAEWRAVTQALDAIRSQSTTAPEQGLSRREQKERAATRQAAEERVLASTLGPERYAELQRSRDRDFRVLRGVADRMELPESAAAQAYEIRRAWSEELRALENQTAMSDEDRRMRAETLRQQARDAVGSLLGDEAFEVYLNNGGDWLRDSPGE